MTWHEIDDDDVQMTWECPDCGRVIEVSPTFYGDAGTPVCAECDIDMVYLYTEVRLRQ